MSHAEHPRYRPDVDGLRAIAVSSVLIYHAYPGVLPGGFAGVDMFFVVSGFLISGIILGQLRSRTFSFARFYERRIRRLFPALALVLFVCLLLGWKILLPHEFAQLGRHLAAGALFVSNFALWSEAGYFDSAAELKPLLHLWSLGIEEQYYICWPLGLFLLRRWLDRLFWPIAALASASFVFNLLLVGNHPEAAYYSPAARGWELLIGSLLAHVALYRPQTLAAVEKLGNSVATAGALLLAAGFVFLDRTRDFPGWWALLPTMGTVLIVAAGPRAWFNRAVLSNPMAVFVGLISYPLYLWHWPILTFSRIVAGKVPPWQVRAAALAISVLLAWATYRFLEKPIRRPTPGRKPRLAILTLAASMAGVGFVGALAFAEQLGSESAAIPVAGEISKAVVDRDPDTERTLSGDSDQAAVFLGDSLMRQYWPRIKKVAAGERRTLAVIFETKDGCAPVPGIERRGVGCDKFMKEAFATAQEPFVRTVVIGASWPGFLTRTDYRRSGDEDGDPLVMLTPQTQWVMEGFERSVQDLVDGGKRVVIMLSAPRNDALDPMRLLYRDGLAWRLRRVPTLPLKTVDSQSARIDAVLRDIARRAGASLIDPSDWLCNRQSCPNLDELGRPIYADGSHVRASVIRERIDALDRFVYIDDGTHPEQVSLALALALTGARAATSDALKLHGNRLFVQVTVNGVEAEALLDSAAEITFIDPRFAAEIKLKPEGSATAKGSGGLTQVQFAKGVNIEAAGVKLTDMTVALLDMTDLSKRLVGSHLQIILGREFFDAARVQIDIAGGTIRKVDSAVEPAGARLPLTSHRGIESLPCKVEGVETQADIDLGNGSDVLIGKAFAEKHGLLKAERIVEHKQGGGIGGAVVRDIVVLSSLEVAGVKFENVRAAIDPQDSAGEVNIGTSILRRFVLVIDYSGHAVWLKPN